VKAKDLRGKNIEDIDETSEEPKEEEDAVAAAYENISKKLESIRKSKEEDDDDEAVVAEVSEEIELEEWKGPKPPQLNHVNEPEEDEEDIKKVNLRNLDSDTPKKDEEEDAIDPLDEDEEPLAVKEKWMPKENDPLDEEEEIAEEDEDKKEEAEEIEEVEQDDKEEETAVDDSEAKSERTERFEAEKNFSDDETDLELPARKAPQPDTLDDLAEEVHHNKPMTGGSGEDDDYYIPNLKGSRQETGELGYNTPSQREGIGQSYSPKGNYMEGNDPNNFFSQHSQPQAPKRANKFHLLVLVLIGIGVIGFTVYILKGGFGDINLGTTEPSPSPSAAATAEPTPTPTPAPEIEKADFTVKVLNGTTTSGLAGKVRDKVKELGYETATPGNNSDTDVEQTEVRVKEGTESAALLQSLIADLAPDYEAIAGDPLDDKAAYDAEVIVGAK
jgi:chemotaxis protein histidine kinase CheA